MSSIHNLTLNLSRKTEKCDHWTLVMHNAGGVKKQTKQKWESYDVSALSKSFFVHELDIESTLD